MNLFNKINLFKEASLRGDMAKRIMYSIIPFVNNNRIDFKSLKYAIEGINELIKYGAEACIDEVRHSIVKDSYFAGKQALKSNNYEEALNIAYECFNDDTKWESSLFGGYAWAKIAKSLLTLIGFKKGLKSAIENKDLQQELAIMKDMVIELNIFDSLNHNTDSIFPKLLEKEAPFHNLEDFDLSDIDTSNLTSKQLKVLKEKLEKRKSYNQRTLDVDQEKSKTRNLMDAKELSNPIDVFREIEKSLIDSGDISKYKDFVEKLKTHPQYKNYDRNALQLEKNKIIFRKDFIYILHNLNKKNDELFKLSNDIKNNPTNDEENKQILFKILRKIKTYMLQCLERDPYNFIVGKLLILQADINSLVNDFIDTSLDLEDDELNKYLLETIEKARSLVYKVIFLIESV